MISPEDCKSPMVYPKEERQIYKINHTDEYNVSTMVGIVQLCGVV